MMSAPTREPAAWRPLLREVVCVIVRATAAPAAPLAVLTSEERARADRFRFARHAAAWSAWRAGLRILLGRILDLPAAKVPLTISRHGKPLLPAPYDSLRFNLSHCDDLALYAFSFGGPVGVDVEPSLRAPDLSGCARSFCHPVELQHAAGIEGLDRSQFLLGTWTAKEALLKALGTGLGHPPEEVNLTPCSNGWTATSDSPLPGLADIHALCLRHPALATHTAALACLRDSGPVRILEVSLTSGCPEE